MMEKTSRFHKEIRHHKDGERKVFTTDSIATEESLGKGAFGKVYKRVLNKGTHSVEVAIKDYTDPDYARRAFENYHEVKAAGIKVLPTVRLDYENNQLLSTLAENENFALIDKGRTSVKTEKIANFKELIKQVSDCLKKAQKKKIYLEADSYFFIVDKADPSQADFVIGDFDFINWKKPEDSAHLERLNSVEANYALRVFVNSVVSNSDELKTYHEIIQETFPMWENKDEELYES